MPNADTRPIRNTGRLRALRATGLLDAPPQEALDRLTRLASRLLGVPIALVSLVDQDRQRFASQVGVGEPWASLGGTPLSHSFCQHVVATRAPLVITDARSHSLVSDNLAVPELGVIAYAGMPLTSAEGEVLGSFCAIDTHPRQWTEEQLSTLQDLAQAAITEIQLRTATSMLASRQSFLATLLDYTTELVCATDAEGHIAYANATMVEATGYTADELSMRRPSDLVGDEARAEFRTTVMQVRDGEPARDIETVIVTKDGRRLICRGQAVPIVGEAGTVDGARIIFRDITRERAAQQLKDELIALVSHELRSPISAVRGALAILGPHVAHLDGRPRQLFQMALRNSDRLLALVNDLLDIERLESGRVTLALAPVLAKVALDHAREAMQPLADQRDIRIDVDASEDLTAMADAARLEQVLVNLIGNAIKFSPAGSTITLSALGEVVDERSMVRFVVSDQGRGIPADKLEQVFERFEQVTASDASEKGGAGLGLAISRAIVVEHEGRIWVESVEGEGSRFLFTIPAAS